MHKECLSESALTILTSTIILSLLTTVVTAWSPDAHNYMRPQNYSIDCTIADQPDFQRIYPYGGFIYHVCYDNKTDSLPRLVAKYYVKKYYVEGREDPNLLGAAAHLLQDAACPDHWYPTRMYFGRAFVPFAPNWVGTIEEKVHYYLDSGEPDWNVPIEFQGGIVNINKAYLDKQREFIEDFLSREPEESLEQIEKQIQSKYFWQQLRSVKEWFTVVIVLMLPFFAYDGWKWKSGAKTMKKKTDLIDTAIFVLVFGIFASLLLLVHLFY